VSRIGKLPIPVPKGVTVTIKDDTVYVKGPKGELNVPFHGRVTVKLEDDRVLVDRPADDRQSRAYHGLYQRLINNCVIGVTEGFRKELLIEGVGFRANMEGQDLNLSLGFSHPVKISPRDGVSFQTPKQTQVIIEGINKQAVGQIASEIRALRPVEPYKGKGVRYSDERVIRKAGKSAKK
jgi:large subunit ribosomal protein L6